MLSVNKKDSYMFSKTSSLNFIDQLEQWFISAGWEINKKEQEVYFDKGWGKIFPASSYGISQGGYPSASLLYPIAKYWGVSRDGLPRSSGSITAMFASVDSAFFAGKPITISAVASIGGTLDISYKASPNGASSLNLRTLYSYGGTFQTVTIGTTSLLLNPGENSLLVQTSVGRYDPFMSSLDIFTLTNSSDYENLGQKSSRLYVHKQVGEENLYLSVHYSYEECFIRFYVNTGFDTSKTVSTQPGNITSSDNNSREYFYIRIPEYWHPRFNSDVQVNITDASFFFSIFSEITGAKGAQYFYYGQVDKFFNFNGGAVVTGTAVNRYTVSTSTPAAGASSYYVLYEGTWYGQTIASSVSNKQGFIDLVTPSNYTTAGYNHYSGEIFVTQQVAGVNLGITDNFEYKPIGTIHNFYKHYGVTPTLPMELKINGDTYWSIPLDANNRKAVKAVEA